MRSTCLCCMRRDEGDNARMLETICQPCTTHWDIKCLTYIFRAIPAQANFLTCHLRSWILIHETLVKAVHELSKATYHLTEQTSSMGRILCKSPCSISRQQTGFSNSSSCRSLHSERGSTHKTPMVKIKTCGALFYCLGRAFKYYLSTGRTRKQNSWRKILSRSTSDLCACMTA